MITAHAIIEKFKLQAHPEGGYFAETYRSEEKVGKRNVSTAIYFLLPDGSKSNFHRIKSDEVWHFYLGGPMSLYQISPTGLLEVVTLGSDILSGHKLQHVVPAGYWFGGFPHEGTEYSFVGCTVSPGFDFQDFELGQREQLVSAFPKHHEIIDRLTER